MATDVDIDTQLEYKLLTENDLFEIEPYRGRVFLIGKLDYEMKREHALKLQVPLFIIIDHGTPHD